jgi:hypothetical protein
MTKKLIFFLILFPIAVQASEPRWNEGIKPDGMYEFALWGLTARWIKEEDKITKLCFFYMRRFVTCSNIPLTTDKK